MKCRTINPLFLLSLAFGGLFATEAVAAEIKHALSFELSGCKNQPTTVVFSKDLKWLATSCRPGRIEVWDVNKNSRVAEWERAAVESDSFLPRPGQSPVPFIFLSNPTELLVASGTNVAVHESLTGKVIRILESPPAQVASMTLSPGGNRLVGSVGWMDNRQSVFWNLSDGKIISQLPTKPDPSERRGMPRRGRDPFGNVKLPVSISPGECRALNQNGDRFAAGLGGFAQVDIWDLESGKCLETLSPSLSSGSRSTDLAFLTGQKLAVVFDQRELSVFALNTNASTPLLRHPRSPRDLDSLEIRSLAVAGDGRRMAVAGMRMGTRPAVMAPKGDVVFDLPMHGEIQVWDAVGMKVISTIKGKPDEKFSQVALDDSGQRVIAVTTGVPYTPRMTQSMQQSEERAPKASPRVYVWELPGR